MWPGPVHFPDFSGPKGQEYWQILNQEWYDSGARFHGLWIDMNEPSNFVQGAAYGSSRASSACATLYWHGISLATCSPALMWYGVAEPHSDLVTCL